MSGAILGVPLVVALHTSGRTLILLRFVAYPEEVELRLRKERASHPASAGWLAVRGRYATPLSQTNISTQGQRTVTPGRDECARPMVGKLLLESGCCCLGYKEQRSGEVALTNVLRYYVTTLGRGMSAAGLAIDTQFRNREERAGRRCLCVRRVSFTQTPAHAASVPV